MTYRLNPIVEKITSPIILKVDDLEMEYGDGTSLAQKAFDRNYLVESISAQKDRVVVTLKPNDRVNVVDWVGEEAVGFD